jgi:hypothetical protein
MLSCETLKSALDLHEPFKTKGSLIFSWDNQRLGGGKVTYDLHCQGLLPKPS